MEFYCIAIAIWLQCCKTLRHLERSFIESCAAIGWKVYSSVRSLYRYRALTEAVCRIGPQACGAPLLTSNNVCVSVAFPRVQGISLAFKNLFNQPTAAVTVWNQLPYPIQNIGSTITSALTVTSHESWASYQIRKIAGCACAGNTGNVFPATDFKVNR